MSRSYKKNLVIKRGDKKFKRLYNRNLRRIPINSDFGNYGWYKKANETWEILDYVIWLDSEVEYWIDSHISYEIRVRKRQLEEFDRYNNEEWVKANRPKLPMNKEVHKSYDSRIKNWHGYRYFLFFLNKIGTSQCYTNDFNEFESEYYKSYRRHLETFERSLEHYTSIERPYEITERDFNRDKMIQREIAVRRSK